MKTFIKIFRLFNKSYTITYDNMSWLLDLAIKCGYGYIYDIIYIHTDAVIDENSNYLKDQQVINNVLNDSNNELCTKITSII